LSSTLSPKRSVPLQLVPELLDNRTGSRNSRRAVWPIWLQPGGTELFGWSLDSDQQTTQPSLIQKPDLAIIETEPWTPPANAAPEISLIEFIRGAWRILEPAVPFVEGWHIDMLCDHLEALSTNRLLERDVLINEPPDTSKSIITMVMWPAWEWTWAPWTRWLTSSYDDGLALRDAVQTRRLMQTEWYRSKMADPWTFTSDQNVKGYYLNNRTGWRISTSMNGGNTGWHAHRVVVDDPHNVKTGESEAVRASTLTSWKEVYPSRVLPGGARVMVGQRVHEEDCTADWLDRERDTIHHIELQEEYEVPENKLGTRIAGYCSLTGGTHDRRTVEGDLLTPERFPREKIEQRKVELGPYAYSAQYQQRPTPRAGMVLDAAWFPQTPRLERSTVDLVAAFDLNYSDAETSDWTIGMLAAVERTPLLPRIHIIDVLRAHLSEEKHVENISDWLMLWKPILVGIEKRAFEKQGATRDLCRQLMGYCAERNHALTLEPIEADADKVTRAMIIPGRAKAGLITVDKAAGAKTWWPILSRQMSQFPKSAHDDDVDALAHLVRLVVEKLETVRGQMRLLGHSSNLSYTEENGRTPDHQLAAMAGLR
jgi:predicted phage terminase large subunit-like protein